MAESFVDRSAVLPESRNLRIQRLDGGWIVLTAGEETPLACRNVFDVLACVRLFLRDQSPLPWALDTAREPTIGSNCSISKIDQGFLATVVVPSGNTQYMRFIPYDILQIVARWAGLVDPLSPTAPTSSPIGDTHQ